jgi:hypothetical protein
MAEKKLFGKPVEEEKKLFGKPVENKISIQDPILVEEDDKGFFESVGDQVVGAGAGLISGALKIPEGFASLGAELIDLGLDTNTAESVEDFFDKLNPFEEVAQETLTGKIVEGLAQFGVPSVAGYKIGAKLASNFLKAKRAGKTVSLKKTKSVSGKKRQEYLQKKKQTRKEKFLIGSAGLGGATVGETAAYQGDLDTLSGDFIEELTGSSALRTDKEAREPGRSEATRRILNRAKFGIEAGLIGGALTGIFTGVSAAAKTGGRAAYSDDVAEKIYGKIANQFTPAGPVSKRFFAEQRAATDAIEAFREVASDTALGLQSTAEDIAKSIKGGGLFRRLDPKKFEELKRLIQNKLENYGSKLDPKAKKNAVILDKESNSFEYIYTKGSKEDIADKQLRKFLKDNNVDQKLADRLDTDLFIARNQVDVFSEKIAELAQKKIATAKEIIDDPLASKKAKADAIKVKKEAEKLLKATTNNYGSYLTKEYQLVKNKPGGALANGLSKYDPAEDAILEAENFFVGKLQKYKLAELKNSDKVKSKLLEDLKNKKINAKQYEQLLSKNARTMLNSSSVQNGLRDQASDIVNYIINQSGKNIEDAVNLDKNLVKQLQKEGLDINENILKARKLPPELRALYGEIRDPIYNIANTLSKQAEFIAKYESFDNLLKANKNKKGQNTVFFKKDELMDVAKRLKIDPEKNLVEIKTSGPLKTPIDGMYTFKEVAEAINSQGFAMQDNWYNNLYKYMILYPKSFSNQAKTIFSPFTHVRNFVSAAMFTTMNGNILFQDPRLTGRLFKEAFLDLYDPNSARAIKSRIDRTRLGVRGTSVTGVETEKLARESGLDLVNKNYTGFLGKTVGSMTNKLAKGFRDAYVWEDNVWKGFNFEAEKYAFRKNLEGLNITSKKQITPEFIKNMERLIGRKIGTEGNIFNDPLFRKNIFKQEGQSAYRDIAIGKAVADEDLIETFTENMAAEITKNNIPNYEYVGQFIKNLRRLPLGTFVAFPAEIIRTGINTIQRGAREAITPGFRATGTRRLLGTLTTATVVPAGLVELGNQLYDVTKEEMNALRRIVPSWSENGLLMGAGRDKKGQLEYADLSYIFPYDQLIRPVTTMFNEVAKGEATEESINKSLFDAGVKSMAELAKPFVSESIFAEAFVDLTIRRGRDASDRQVWNPEDPVGEKLYKGTMHILDPFIPGSYKAGTRIAQSAQNKTDKFGRTYDLKDEALGIFGYKVQKADPDRSAPFIFSEFKDLKGKAQTTFTADILRGGEITPAEIIEQYIGSELRRFEIYKNFYQDVNALKTLKIDRVELDRQYERLTKNDRGFLETGQYVPSLPTKGTIDKFIQNYMKLEENTGRTISPTLFEALPKIMEFYQNNIGKTIDDMLEIDLSIPPSFYQEQKKEPAKLFGTPVTQTTPDTGPGSVVTGQGPTIQGQGSTLDQTDVRFRKGTLTDPTERLIAGVD